MDKQQRPANHLITETSPYLQQHLYNPIDWFPWAAEALEKAKNEDKPIFLSIGYSACHWCHVMEKESFEDEQVAHYLNQYFVSIKVDREERPDLDSIYMNALVRMTGQGGWPMTVFLTPELQPFFGGTYFPPAPRQGMISFLDLLKAIHQAWQHDRQHIFEAAQKVTESLATDSTINKNSNEPLRLDFVETARDALVNAVDWQNGGWGRAPKFPQPLLLEFLCQQAWRGHEPSQRAIILTLETMSRGGMYDLVGGGFHRYSTDAHWLAPHFEKMLYDNAQLALVYLHAYLLTRKREFERICTHTLDFIVRDMTDARGGFYSSLDADTQSEEGKYYLWSETELQTLLSDEQLNILKTACPYPVEGNFDGKILFRQNQNMDQVLQRLNLTNDELTNRLDEIILILRNARNGRPHPGVDTKVLASWNGLALRAFAEAGRFLDRHDYLEIAQKNAAFLLSNLKTPAGLHRSWADGIVRFSAFLEDYASLILGLLALYQVDFDNQWFTSACSLRDEMIERFGDPNGGYFDTTADIPGLLLRPKEMQDNAVPSGNSLAVRAELLLDKFTGDSARTADLEKFIAGFQNMLIQYPMSFGSWLQVLDFIKGPVHQIALISTQKLSRNDQLLDYLVHRFIPDSILAVSKLPIEPDAPELLHDRPALNKKPTAYVCQDFFCNLPVTGLQELIAQLP